ASLAGGTLAEIGKLRRVEEQHPVRAGELHAQLIDIDVPAPAAGRGRQWHRPRGGVDRAEEAGGEFRSRLGDHGDTVARLDAERDEAAGIWQRGPAQIRAR